MKKSRAGRSLSGDWYEIATKRSATYDQLIRKIVNDLNLKQNPEKLGLFTSSGTAVTPESTWTLGRYASIKKKSPSSLKFGIGYRSSAINVDARLNSLTKSKSKRYVLINIDLCFFQICLNKVSCIISVDSYGHSHSVKIW